MPESGLTGIAILGIKLLCLQTRLFLFLFPLLFPHAFPITCNLIFTCPFASSRYRSLGTAHLRDSALLRQPALRRPRPPAQPAGDLFVPAAWQWRGCGPLAGTRPHRTPGTYANTAIPLHHALPAQRRLLLQHPVAIQCDGRPRADDADVIAAGLCRGVARRHPGHVVAAPATDLAARRMRVHNVDHLVAGCRCGAWSGGQWTAAVQHAAL